MRNGEATITDRLDTALFIAHYGWSYQQLLDAPSWLVALLDMKLTEDAKFERSKKRSK